jgi:hypothetical protein
VNTSGATFLKYNPAGSILVDGGDGLRDQFTKTLSSGVPVTVVNCEL